VCVQERECVFVRAQCEFDASWTRRSLSNAVVVDECVCVGERERECVCVSARCELDTSQTRRSLVSAVALDEGVCACVWVCAYVCL